MRSYNLVFALLVVWYSAAASYGGPEARDDQRAAAKKPAEKPVTTRPVAEKPATPASTEQKAEDSHRTWTSADGKHTVEARFVKADNDTVYLEKRDGSEIVSIHGSWA
jgi:hypothetical protein